MNAHLLLKNNNSYQILKNSEINIKVKKNQNTLKHLFTILNRLIAL